jgi:hypothetical protein
MFRTVIACGLLLLAGCWGSDDGAVHPPDPDSIAGSDVPDPPHAKRHLVESNRRLRSRTPHVSDGQGRGWIVDGEPRIVSGAALTHRVTFEVGNAGVATGGSIIFRVAPYWSWSPPQTDDAEAVGYTVVRAAADGVVLTSRTASLRSVVIENSGRPLVGGDRIYIEYGAGKAGAKAVIAERGSRFWIAVDGDGDGTHSYLDDSPRLDVWPAAVSQLVVTLPATARPGEEAFLSVAALDAFRNAVRDWTGTVNFDRVEGDIDVPQPLTLKAGDGGHARIPIVARSAGIVRVSARGPGGIRGDSNPMEVSVDRPRILWGDLHGHSNLSDGAGTPDDYFRYARDVAGLDVIALTDHDYWSVEPLDLRPDLWEQIQKTTERFHAPGRLVTFLGFEWTNWVHGHRHVLYGSDRAPLLSSIDSRYDTPAELWHALAGRDALTLAHHSAGGPIATNWDIPPDPSFEPQTEIASIHGSSEALGSPRKISRQGGNYVRDALARGYRLGFVGSGDNHAGQPGSLRNGNPPGGLAAILSERNTREGVFDAMRARRTYATNGPRIILRAMLGEHPIGAQVPVPASGLTRELQVDVAAHRPLRRIDLIRSGEVVEQIAVDEALDFSLRREVRNLRAGEYVYVRAIQHGGGTAWSSPFYAVAESR